MRLVAALAMAVLACGSAASAQTPAAADTDRGYVEGFGQAAFSNVSSQSYGVEFGITVRPGIQVYGEIGMVRNVATAEISAAAQTIASFLAQTNSNVGYNVKEPVTSGAGGVKFLFPTTSAFRPYVMGGGGVAQVKQDVTFTINGTDVTSSLGQYGVVLGSDLSGSFTKPMIEFGGGVMWAGWQRLVLDAQLRYGRIFAEDAGINVTRAGVGVGVRF